MYVKVGGIYSNPTWNRGRLITMTGFITPDTTCGPNSFFLGRMMVWCCAADAMPVGFYCVTDSTLGLRENDWVVLTGKAEVRSVKFPWEKDKRTIPLLRVVTARKSARPRNEYIYR